MMKRLKICCFLGLALLLLTLPVRGAELPPDVERALPREAGQLLKDVDHWDVNSFPEGLCAIWNHLRKDVNTVLRRQTRGAVSVLLVAVLCGLVSGFQKGLGFYQPVCVPVVHAVCIPRHHRLLPLQLRPL